MRPGSLAQMLHPFRDSSFHLVANIRTALVSAGTTGAIQGPNDLWFYGPQREFQRVEDIPAVDRVDSRSLAYVRPAKTPPAIDTARELLQLGCTPAQAIRLTGCHPSLVYRDLASRAERGVCPCCARPFKPGSAAALA